jgi:hypothetical protein
MQYVAQEHESDCGVAVLAMLTGRTLVETCDWIKWHGRDLQPAEMHWWLWRDGFYLRSVKLRVDLPGWSDEEGWPPVPFRPFAPAHYLMVTAAKGGHWVALDGDGALLDPWDRARQSLDAYSAVHEIVGVRKESL